jgi:hypothetical protein
MDITTVIFMVFALVVAVCLVVIVNDLGRLAVALDAHLSELSKTLKVIAEKLDASPRD